MKQQKFILISIITAYLLVGQASAKIVSTDQVFPHELLYVMIAFVALLFTLIIWDSRATTANAKHSMNLEILLRFIMGAGSALLSFALSTILSSESVIYATAADTWAVASEWLSIFFLVWGFFMCVYTLGMLLKYFNERTATAERGINNVRNARK